jgi:hypothetical protein
MRVILAAIVTMGMATWASAEPPAKAARGVPLPSIGLPLPSIGLPLPPIGLPAPEAPPPHAGPPRGPHGRRPYPSVVYVFPVYGAWPYPYLPEAPAVEIDPGGSRDVTPSVTALRTGRLRVDADPVGDDQLYIDGYYVGRPSDFPDGVELVAGPHAVELRAPGYQTAHVDLLITADRSVTFPGTLRPVKLIPEPPAPAASSPASAPSTFYVIPGCYVGNVPPDAASLPPGCDVSQTKTIRP